ncbi:unnamed protein product [Callosobruchus maculatus]|uniref:Uncharacterized protein n=1 Tax=Callosobruchus maculatus TaxID=64391 RepID=A0A653DNY1_CALMS|nr:unnamed protein product [Callosobruchus maculatus]
MVTPHFSKLCHGHLCLLNAPYLNLLSIKEPRYTKL